MSKDIETEEVDVWHLEFSIDGEPEISLWWGINAEVKCREAAGRAANQDCSAVSHIDGYDISCVRVTGPHKQLIPKRSPDHHSFDTIDDPSATARSLDDDTPF